MKNSASSNDASRRVVVIGYGSTLRSDDAAGQAVAHRLASQPLHGVHVLTPLHLTPDIAHDLGAADLAIFVDAAPAEECPEVRVCELRFAPGQLLAASSVGHAGDPRGLLDMADALYGHRPEAWMVAVPAYCMDVGDTLSPGTAKHVEEAAARIRRLIAERNAGSIAHA